MEKIQHYVQGAWTTGTEEGPPIYDAITGEAFTNTFRLKCLNNLKEGKIYVFLLN